MKVAIIIPAYNEATRIGAVLDAVQAGADEWDIVVVNDGSTDETAAVARGRRGVSVLDLPRNRGKGGAMWAGALAADAEILVFLDADLRGVEAGQIQALVEPLRSQEAEMTVGLFRGGRSRTDFSHVITPWVSGQRALLRREFLSLPWVAEARHGVEALLTRAARERRWSVQHVSWSGVTHAMKEEKFGPIRGFLARLRMYREIVRSFLAPLPARRDKARARSESREA